MYECEGHVEHVPDTANKLSSVLPTEAPYVKFGFDWPCGL